MTEEQKKECTLQRDSVEKKIDRRSLHFFFIPPKETRKKTGNKTEKKGFRFSSTPTETSKCLSSC